MEFETEVVKKWSYLFIMADLVLATFMNELTGKEELLPILSFSNGRHSLVGTVECWASGPLPNLS